MNLSRKLRSACLALCLFPHLSLAGWSSAVITVCNENGCYPVNQPVENNPPSTYCY